MVHGLKSLEVLSLAKSNPIISCQLFVQGIHKILTAESMYDLFTAELSPPMSNQRDKEEAHLFNWLNFLQYVEGMLDLLLHLN